MIQGARQVGKTYLVNQFCKTEYSKQVYWILNKIHIYGSYLQETLISSIYLKKSIFVYWTSRSDAVVDVLKDQLS